MAQTRRLCEPCLSDEVEELASVYCYDCNENLCDTCAKIHKKFKSFKGHKIGDLVNVPFVIAERFFDTLTACPCETSQPAVFYCINHNHLCCNECSDNTHSTCKKLDSQALHTQPQLKDEIQHWDDLKSIIEHSEKQVTEIVEHESNLTEKTAKTETTLAEQLHTIKATIDDAFSQLESTVTQEFNQKKDSVLASTHAQEESAGSLKDEINEIKDKMDLIDNHGSHTHKLLFGRTLQAGTMKRIEETIEQLYHNATLSIIETELSTALADVSNTIQALIQVHLLNRKPSFLWKPPFQKHPTLLAALNLRDKSYKDWFYPEGCVWLGDFIIISVSGQNVVKLVNADSYSVVDTYNCSSEPLALCVMDDNQVGVWLPKNVQLEVLAVTEDGFKHVKDIELTCKARDVQYDTDKKQIIALCRESGDIRILDEDGEPVETITLDKKLSEVVEDSLRFRFCRKDQLFYISGYCMHHVVAMDRKGAVVFDYKHKNLRYPVGSDFDHDGNVLVASWKGQSIHEVDNSGQHRRVLLEGELYYPQSICFNEDRDKFAVIHTLAGSHLHIYNYED